jgi:acyl-CoA thioesterase I
MKTNLLVVFALTVLAACAPDGADRQPGDQVPSPASTDTSTEAGEVDRDEVVVVYLGDSLTAGYGLPGGPDDAYPAILEDRFEAEGISVRTVNAGVSGDTSAGGRSRLGWYLDRHDVDVLLVALGANDGLRGLPPSLLYDNLIAIVDGARERQPGIRVVLAGMMMPVSMGGPYAEEFRQVYTRVADERDVELVPFLLEGVGGVRALNQPDGVHPTREGQVLMADNVWETLFPVVRSAHRKAS